MNTAHKNGRLRNRLGRLRKKLIDIGPDRKAQIVKRIEEITAILGRA